MSNVATAILKKGREDSLLRRHPWVFSGAIDRVTETPEPGATVIVRASDGRFLGSGAWSPESQLRVRIWSFRQEESIDPDFFRQRIARAAELRDDFGFLPETNAYRLISSEADGLPGLVVDRYADHLVCQFHGAGVEFWRVHILNALRERFTACRVLDRSDGDVRKREGLPDVGMDVADGIPDAPVEVCEHGMPMLADIVHGHKTGMYLDQRENRALLGSLAEDADILNCFSYTGGFACAALHGGARSVLDCDLSGDALALAQRNVRMQSCDEERYKQQQGDVFLLLRSFRDAARSFDIIVLDPPKFAWSASTVTKAARGYKDINLLAFKLLRPGGMLLTFSCSGHITTPLFRKIVADAAVDARVDATVLRELTQAADHPIALHVPESLYLKGLLLRL